MDYNGIIHKSCMTGVPPAGLNRAAEALTAVVVRPKKIWFKDSLNLLGSSSFFLEMNGLSAG